MNLVVRVLAVYVFLLIMLRFAGKRSLAHMTMFDFVLLLILSETTQQALVGNDYSLTAAFLAILLLISAEIGLSIVKHKVPAVEKWLEGYTDDRCAKR